VRGKHHHTDIGRWISDLEFLFSFVVLSGFVRFCSKILNGSRVTQSFTHSRTLSLELVRRTCSKKSISGELILGHGHHLVITAHQQTFLALFFPKFNDVTEANC
jgi:hypothetical protein